MSCNCHGPATNTNVAAVKKKPCGPCKAAADAIASVTPPHTFHGVGAASETDLTTIQTFLQSLTPNSPPTAADIASAQQAATDLSASVFTPTPIAMSPAPNTTTVSNTVLILGGLAVAIGGASVAYLYTSSKKSRRRR